MPGPAVGDAPVSGGDRPGVAHWPPGRRLVRAAGLVLEQFEARRRERADDYVRIGPDAVTLVGPEHVVFHSAGLGHPDGPAADPQGEGADAWKPDRLPGHQKDR